MDGDVVLSKYLTMRACFPRATISYAVKANPVSLNIAAEQLSYGNPLKSADDIAYAL
jgi:diaminopimelate decarboxylase